MVEAVRCGQSLRAVAKRFGVSPATVQHWVRHAKDEPLEQVYWEDGSHSPHQVPNKTMPEMEQRILQIRLFLSQHSDLGEWGARAIQSYLQVQGEPSIPSVATINRILARNGVFDARQRVRRKPPLPGWYLPDVADRRADIDETDFVEGLFLEGGEELFVLNTISLHGGLCDSWLTSQQKTEVVLECLQSHWRAYGLPRYAQFDNGNVFAGPHQYPDTVGRVIALCLSLGVTPVFAVPREFGIQSAIESYNNRWQQKVWQRFCFADLPQAQACSARYVAAVRKKYRQRQESAPSRRAFPTDWQPPTQIPRQGKVVFLRRTNAQSEVELLGHTYPLAIAWYHRLVRCEVDLVANKIQVYGLRRADPQSQPLLSEWDYRLPDWGSKRS
jgi:transposase